MPSRVRSSRRSLNVRVKNSGRYVGSCIPMSSHWCCDSLSGQSTSVRKSSTLPGVYAQWEHAHYRSVIMSKTI
jgi:hypothetical protein